MNPISIQKNITEARTLPNHFYTDPSIFEWSKEHIFAPSWQLAAPIRYLEHPGQLHPFHFLDAFLPEPLLLTRDKENHIRCLSNVCTHRAKVLVETPQQGPLIRCGYHGRCFRLDGSFKSTPGFEEACHFPDASDNLPTLPIAVWHPLVFTTLEFRQAFADWIQPIQDRLHWLPFDKLRFIPEASKDYMVNAHWALYVDNYLEGFHIPYVHPALNSALDKHQYAYELFEQGSLQVGIANQGELCFDIPDGAQDSGRNVYAYYYWLFPNLMFNFYPWGLSLNIVEPISPGQSKIRFLSFAFEGTTADQLDYQLEATELEDEAVVESVQQGIRSRFYKSGRFSPSMEKGVHHFHRLLAQRLSDQF